MTAAVSPRGMIPVFVLWIGLLCSMFFGLLVHETTPGRTRQVMPTWPTETSLRRGGDACQLLVFLHPYCPCSRATLRELERIRGHLGADLEITVLASGAVDAGTSSLLSAARSIPGVTVIADPERAEARLFGAATSGESLLFSKEGMLLFRGGITSSRGHEGDNDGSRLIEALSSGALPEVDGCVDTPTYGCPIFNN